MADTNEPVDASEGAETVQSVTELNFHSFSQTLRKIVNEIFRLLGRGYDKEIYEHALKYELTQKEIPFDFHKEVPVKYKEHDCGVMIADFYLSGEQTIIHVYADPHEPTLKNLQQAKNQMRAMNELPGINLQSCVIVNFGSPYVNQRAEPDFIIITHV